MKTKFNIHMCLWLILVLVMSTTIVVAQEDPIVIGASMPMSGRMEINGTAAAQGYEVWVEMINEEGGLLGRPVELIMLDNTSEQDVAVAQYEQLITEDEVDLVLGPNSSFLVIPTSEVAAKYGYAFVEPAGGSPAVFNRGLTNLFFAQPAPAARQADPFVDYILNLPENEQPKTFAVATSDDTFPISVMERIKSLLLITGAEVVYESVYPVGTTEFSDIAAEVAELDPDLIIGGTQASDSSLLILALMDAGYQPRIAYFTSGPSVPEPFRESLGSATEGIFSSVSWFSEANEYQNADFAEKYVEMFGGTLADIPEDAANTFTVGQVMQQAIENIESIDNEALIEELHSGTYRTVVGDLSFDNTGAPEGSFMLVQWQGDKFVVVGPQNRAEIDPLPLPKPAW